MLDALLDLPVLLVVVALDLLDHKEFKDLLGR
jgi:hypothetical protein